MLGLLVFGVIAIWVALTDLILIYLIRRIWRGVREKQGIGWHVKTAVLGLFVLAWLASFFWYGGGQNYYYDAQVKRMCAIDGGIKVYETVKLLQEKFNQWGHVNFFHPAQHENALRPEYIHKYEIIYYRKNYPQIRKLHTQILRKSDMKLLGESMTYDRGGGDFMSEVVSASEFRCPEIKRFDSKGLFGRVFVN